MNGLLTKLALTCILGVGLCLQSRADGWVDNGDFHVGGEQVPTAHTGQVMWQNGPYWLSVSADTGSISLSQGYIHEWTWMTAPSPNNNPPTPYTLDMFTDMTLGVGRPGEQANADIQPNAIFSSFTKTVGFPDPSFSRTIDLGTHTFNTSPIFVGYSLSVLVDVQGSSEVEAGFFHH